MAQFDIEFFFIHWIEIYPVDSVIRPSNNRGQINKALSLGFSSTCLSSKQM